MKTLTQREGLSHSTFQLKQKHKDVTCFLPKTELRRFRSSSNVRTFQENLGTNKQVDSCLVLGKPKIDLDMNLIQPIA